MRGKKKKKPELYNSSFMDFVKLWCSVVVPYLKKNVVEQDRKMKSIIKLYKLYTERISLDRYVTLWLLEDR